MSYRFLPLRGSLLACLIVTLALAISGCGGDREDPTPTPTKTPNTQAAATAPTNTPVPADVQTAATTPTPQAAAPAEATPAPTTKTMATVTAELLNVRNAPSSDGQLMTTLPEGGQYEVIGRSADGAWLQLGDNGREVGWVASEFVTTQTVDLAAGTGGDAGGEGGNGEASTETGAPTAAPQAGGGNYAPASMQSPDFGAQAFLWWRPEIADRDLTLMQEAGFNWVKQTFAWETIEGAGPGIYDWSIADRVVTHVNQSGLKLLARLSSDPDAPNVWAGHPPANGDAFADFAFNLASRYNCGPQAIGCIQAYQIWNEPNLGREWGGNRPNPAEYTEFLRKAYAAIKRANPNAIVISAGMAPTGDNNDVAMPDDLFYDGMYQAMGGNSDGYFDMLGVHGAGFAAPPELDPAEAAANQKYGGYRFFAFRHVEDIHALMERYGDGDKQIALLEFGWTYDPVNSSYKWHGADAGITDMVQADYLKRAYEYASANWRPWIGLMNLLTMPNLDWLNDGNPQDEEQYWWAILDPSPIDQLYLRPAYVVLCMYFNGVKGQSCKYAPPS